MMMGRSELLAKLEQEAAAWDAGSGDVAALMREAKAEIEHLAAAKDQHFAQAMENGAKANAFHAALLNLRAGMADAKNSNIVDYIDAVLGAA